MEDTQDDDAAVYPYVRVDHDLIINFKDILDLKIRFYKVR